MIRPARHYIYLILVLIAGLVSSAAVWANDIIVMSSILSSKSTPSEGLYLDINIEFDLPRSVQDALNKGIPLYFVTEFTVEQERWYWVNKPIIEASLMTRLSYSPLTRQYRVSRGGLSLSFDSLSEALTILKSLHGWRVSDESVLEKPDDCAAEVRVRLDIDQLPLPMQVTIGENDWDLTSDWQTVNFDRSITHPKDSAQ